VFNAYLMCIVGEYFQRSAAVTHNDNILMLMGM